VFKINTPETISDLCFPINPATDTWSLRIHLSTETVKFHA